MASFNWRASTSTMDCTYKVDMGLLMWYRNGGGCAIEGANLDGAT
jgi:hypothetical protein